ncbi:MAG: class I SAM-dependent methyltransferase [Pseudomonadota bacterium]
MGDSPNLPCHNPLRTSGTVSAQEPTNILLENQTQNQLSKRRTQSFYQQNAQSYFDETVELDVSETRQRFLELVTNGGSILDLGCGSGRDSRKFLNLGYQVTPLDVSKALASLANDYIGREVVVQSFQTLNYHAEFDGIWACASLLHCPKSEIYGVFKRVVNALKPGGAWYLSFKRGERERVDERGRFFNDYSKTELSSLLERFRELTIVEVWTEAKPLRGEEQAWVNALVKKRKD